MLPLRTILSLLLLSALLAGCVPASHPYDQGCAFTPEDLRCPSGTGGGGFGGVM